MSNNPDEPEDQQSEDGFDEERLNSAQQHKSFKDAKSRKQESFTSFSEGVPAIDKFQILGVSSEDHPAIANDTTTWAGPKKTVPVETENEPTASEAAAVHGPAKKSKSVMRSAPPEDESFTSFSDGLPTIDKFGIVDPNARALSMDQLLDSFVRPFQSSEKRSRTLDRLIFLIDLVPWKNDLKVERSSKPDFAEYCFDESTFVLDQNFSAEQSLLAFAHQAYHATNRLLTKLYGDDEGGMLDRESFIDLYLWSEIAAYITELNVRRELGLTEVTPLKVLCQESSGSKFSINVEEYLQSNGMKALHDLLYSGMIKGSDQLSLVYVFGKLFDRYEQNYRQEKLSSQSQIEYCLLRGLERDCI